MNTFNFFGKYLGMIAITLIAIGIWAVNYGPNEKEFIMSLSIPMMETLIGGLITYKMYKKYKKDEHNID